MPEMKSATANKKNIKETYHMAILQNWPFEKDFAAYLGMGRVVRTTQNYHFFYVAHKHLANW